jgi:uncharacterized membrane protein YtjA (UPF0391 family)
MGPPRAHDAPRGAELGTQAARKGARSTNEERDEPMLVWAAMFLVIAIVAALFGFAGIAASAAAVGKILFIVFLAMAAISFLFGFGRRTFA